MYDKLIFSKAGTEHCFCFKYSEKYLEAIELCESESILGNIYVGVISDYVPNINAIFVNFEKNGALKGFLSLNDGPLVYLNKKNNSKPCKGDRVLVQVVSDKVKTKEYSLTCNINLHGQFLVLVNNQNTINISKKITGNDKRNHLKELLTPLLADIGFIIRTNAVNESDENIKNDAINLLNEYKSIYNLALSKNIGECVYISKSDFCSITMESILKGCKKIYTDDPSIYTLINNCLSENNYYHDYDITVKLYRNPQELNLLFGMEQDIEKTINKKVWLKSGAYLIIEHTEALNVIDVNTGKITKKGDKENIFLQINLEASQAIMREIKKRNLTGIIIVDFINMKSEQSKSILLTELKRLALLDEINTNIVGFTNLGLVEITRKRNKKPLYDLVTH